MIAAARSAHRGTDTRLLIVRDDGRMLHTSARALPRYLHPGDLLVGNDAATIPASLHGVHQRTGAQVEVRLAGRRSLAAEDVRDFVALVFGDGDYRTRTEDRPAPPALRAGDRLRLGPLQTTILRPLDHPRLVLLQFSGTPQAIWSGIAAHGRPIQYAHVPRPLRLWDVWTPVASLPVAFEPPSAGFLLDWGLLAELRTRRIGFATLTHAAGISSTGDPDLDRRLPLAEPYRIPGATADAVARTRARGGRVIAVGTTVTRALEDAVQADGRVPPGPGLAVNHLGAETPLRVVDGIITGVHEPGTSHFELLRAFVADELLGAIAGALDRLGYLGHDFGDAVLLPRLDRASRLVLPAEPVSLACAS